MVFSAEQNYLSNLQIYIYIFIMLIIIIINNAFVCSIFNPVHVIFKIPNHHFFDKLFNQCTYLCKLQNT